MKMFQRNDPLVRDITQGKIKIKDKTLILHTFEGKEGRVVFEEADINVKISFLKKEGLVESILVNQKDYFKLIKQVDWQQVVDQGLKESELQELRVALLG